MRIVAETWTPAILDSEEFLPDYSYAGYAWGKKAPPSFESTIAVTEFGAIADDGVDDTTSIQAALKSAKDLSGSVVLHFPAGKFLVRDILYIERSDLVLQGEGSGPGGTVISVTRPLKGMKVPWSVKWLKAYYVLFGKREQGKLYSLFSWTGGVFWTRSPKKTHAEDLYVKIIGGKRGHREIQITHSAGLKPGDVVSIQWFNKEGKDESLLKHIYGDYELDMGKRLYGRFWNPIVTQPVTIERLEENVIVTKEPLLHDLRKEWSPKIVRANYLSQVGVENIRIEFVQTEYAGHHLEDGYNGIYFKDVMHSWIRNVSIHNADSAILADHCKNITLDNVTVTGRPAHYSVAISNCYGALVTNFALQAPAIHNPSFNTKSRLSVYSGGVINKAKLDQHRGINHQNLFDDIDIEYAEDLFAHGGARYWGPTAGRYNTFWNVRIQQAPRDGFLGQCSDAPEARLIGIRGETTAVHFDYGPAPYIEGLNKKGISVPSLYRYQLNKRTHDL